MAARKDLQDCKTGNGSRGQKKEYREVLVYACVRDEKKSV